MKIILFMLMMVVSSFVLSGDCRKKEGGGDKENNGQNFSKLKDDTWLHGFLFKKGTSLKIRNGVPVEGILAKSSTKHGFEWAANHVIRFHSNGIVKEGYIASKKELRSLTIREGRMVELKTSGTLSSGTLSDDVDIHNRPYVARQNTRISLYANDSIKSMYNRDPIICNNFQISSEGPITFYSSCATADCYLSVGYMKSGMLKHDTVYRRNILPKGAVVYFDNSGSVLERVITEKALIIDGVKFKSGADIRFDESGEPSWACILSPLTYAQKEYAPGEKLIFQSVAKLK